MKNHCIFLGDNSLMRLCAERISPEEWEIAGAISRKSEPLEWFRRKGIPVKRTAKNASIKAFIENQVFTDSRMSKEPAAKTYLFSIANHTVLKSEVLSLPFTEAINYHNALLPAFPGLNATTWAILDGRTTHGITWHSLRNAEGANGLDAIDSGAIFLQRAVPIGPDDSVHDLNFKCSEEVVHSFEELVDGLASGTLKSFPQETSANRNYKGKSDLPENSGIIDWRKRAIEISNLIRALDFGNQENPLCSPMFVMENRWFRAVKSQIIEGEAGSPGTILRRDDHALTVVAGDRPIRIVYEPFEGADFREKSLQLDSVHVFKDDELSRYSQELDKLAANESYWKKHIKGCKQEMPGLEEISKEKLRVRLDLDELADDPMIECYFCLALATLTSVDFLSLDLIEGHVSEKPLDHLRSRVLPLHIKLNWLQSFSETTREVIEKIDTHRCKDRCSVDLVKRIAPRLKPRHFFIARSGECPDLLNHYQLGLIQKDGHAWLWCMKAVRGDWIEKLMTLMSNFKAIAREAKQIFADFEGKSLDKAIVESLTHFGPKPAFQFVDGGHVRSFSYADVDRESRLISDRLKKMRIGPGSLVGIHLRRTPELIFSIIAVIRVGAAYVSLDPNYPSDRVSYIKDDARVSALIRHEDADRKDAQSHICIDAFQHVSVTANPTNLAYVIYTSGSTGKPKGVPITHENLLSMVRWASFFFEADELSHTLASTSINFDLHAFELFVPLFNGRRFVLVKDPLELANIGEETKVTLINTVPSVMAALIEADAIPKTVCAINLAGEPLPRQLADKVYAIPKVKRLYNLYGPSEDTTYSTWSLISNEPGSTIDIGRVITQSQGWVLDEGLNRLGPDQKGELYLSGAGVSPGYLHRPGLTAERFLPNEHGGFGDRIYRTGDIVKGNESGSYYYYGRSDNQIKIRGFRVELGEIEKSICRLEGIKDSVCVFIRDLQGGLIASFYTLHPGSSLKPENIGQNLARHLPGHMVPAFFFERESLPLTPNKKVDRKALEVEAHNILSNEDIVLDMVPHASRSPNQESIEDSMPDASLWSSTERDVIDIYRNIFGSYRVAPESSFTALGGDSIKAFRVSSMIKKIFQIPITADKVYQAQTIRDLCLLIEREIAPKPKKQKKKLF